MPDTGDSEYAVRLLIAPLFGPGVSADYLTNYLIIGEGPPGMIYTASAMNYQADRVDLMCRTIRATVAEIPGTWQPAVPKRTGADDADRCASCGHMPAPGSTNCADGCTHECEPAGDTVPLAQRAPEIGELVTALKRDAFPLRDPDERSDMIADLVTAWLDTAGYDLSHDQ